MIRDTACEHCPYKEQGFTICPNYIETFWHEEGNPQPVLVRDCAPKRSLLMLQELYNRNYALQKQASQQEAQIVKLKSVVSTLVKCLKVSHPEKLPPQNFSRLAELPTPELLEPPQDG